MWIQLSFMSNWSDWTDIHRTPHPTTLEYSLLKNSTYIKPRNNRSQKFQREWNHIKHLLQSKENEKKKKNQGLQYMLQYRWPLKLLCQMKSVSHKRINIRFHLYVVTMKRQIHRDGVEQWVSGTMQRGRWNFSVQRAFFSGLCLGQRKSSRNGQWWQLHDTEFTQCHWMASLKTGKR